MADSGRATCVGVWRKALAAFAVFVVAYDKVAGEHIYFLPIRVDNGCRRVHAGLDAQQGCAASLPACFIQVTSENLAVESVRKTRHCLPTFVEIDSVKFLVLLRRSFAPGAGTLKERHTHCQHGGAPCEMRHDE